METKYDFEREFGEQILSCSVCGFCQAVCPIYGLTRRPALNARGKMLVLQEVMKEDMELDEETVETLFQCTGCASCATNCPSGVKVPEILYRVRQEMVAKGTCHPVFSGMNDLLATEANIYAEKDPPEYQEGRKLNETAQYVYFAGCVGAYREEEATETTLDLLDKFDVDYTLIDEVCCSGILEDVGYDVYQTKADAIIDRVRATGARTLLTGCPYCYRVFKNKPQYKGLAESGIDVVHISRFLTDIDFGVATDLTVTYHDPCALGRHAGIYEEPRETIRKIAKNFVE
ncbi:MAG: (Fe-S)-binding protein, partial [Deltaproteobacteria bacterium]|nr:(Fe-S)-binding protein [Deltaproteobacteria bacterium]